MVEATSTPIADMVEQMFAAGAAPNAIAAAVRAVETSRSFKAIAATTTQKRGTRLPDDWQPSEQCVAYAVGRGIARDRVSIEAEKFKNYWTAKTGASATKRDWPATWRNWVITAMERRNGPPRNNPSAGVHSVARSAATGADAVIAGMGRLARRLDERRIATRRGGQMAGDADHPGEFDFERGRT